MELSRNFFPESKDQGPSYNTSTVTLMASWIFWTAAYYGRQAIYKEGFTMRLKKIEILLYFSVLALWRFSVLEWKVFQPWDGKISIPWTKENKNLLIGWICWPAAYHAIQAINDERGISNAIRGNREIFLFCVDGCDLILRETQNHHSFPTARGRRRGMRIWRN